MTGSSIVPGGDGGVVPAQESPDRSVFIGLSGSLGRVADLGGLLVQPLQPKPRFGECCAFNYRSVVKRRGNAAARRGSDHASDYRR
jgi:hypothetical protein